MRVLPIIMFVAATPALAQEGPAGLSFEVGVGAQSAPGYFGAPENETGVTGSGSLGQLTFGSISLGGDATLGFGFTGSFRFIGERTSEDYAELAGLEDIDAAIEIGGGVTYTWDDAEVFAVVRRGFGGHEGYVAELGGDLIMQAAPNLTLRAGPRISAGDETFADTYFSVSAAEAAASSFDAYQAGEGILSRGFEVSADYDFNADWGVIGTLRYDQWLNDAADSPIVQAGSDDSVTASLVVTRAISFGF